MNLLIIDDDSICSFINTRVAQTCGAFEQITSLHNGQDALDFFNDVCAGTTPAPDVILLDLNMPLINGFDFIKEFQKLPVPGKEKIEIVILTSSEQAHDIERARNLGVHHYLLKPLTVNHLQSTIFSLDKKLRGRRAQ